MAGGFSVTIDPAEWYRLKQELDRFDPALARSLRKRIREAGQAAVDKVKETLEMPSPAGGPDEGTGRAALAAATRVSVSFGKRAAGARIVTSPSKLPAEHKALLSVYNKRSFRHPVYGNRRNWVTQEGRPYFYGPIKEALDEALVGEIREALDDAMRAIGARAL